MKPGDRFQIGEGTSQTFVRESRDQRPFAETEPPHYWTRAEIGVYVACAVAILALAGIFAYEYFNGGF